jgi:hypothetical protein
VDEAVNVANKAVDVDVDVYADVAAAVMDEAVGPPMLPDKLIDTTIIFPAGADADDDVPELTV